MSTIIESHVQELLAIAWCNFDEPVWKARQAVQNYLEEHFELKRAWTAADLKKIEELRVQVNEIEQGNLYWAGTTIPRHLPDPRQQEAQLTDCWPPSA